MKARAPGKVVLSGAYAVLEGAPAIVTAVDRYVVADAARSPDFITPEQREAFGDRPVPHFDASALRGEGRKLGLGSSAAILVASLAAAHAAAHGHVPDAELRDAVFDRAVRAHHAAQQGGSGIDVATSCHGGTIVARRREGAIEIEHAVLPGSVHLEVWAADQPASTPALLASVRALAKAQPKVYSLIIDALTVAAESAVEAARAHDAAGLIRALGRQASLLDELGRSAAVPIVTDEVRQLAELASDSGAVVMPAGAGGGDIAIYAGLEPPLAELVTAAATRRHTRLGLQLEARGVHCLCDA